MKVIVAVLKLISLYNSLFIEEKIEHFLSEIVEAESQLMASKQKEKLIEEIVTKKILKEPMKGREDIIRLLLLLFYNNNTFNINYASIELLSHELFAESKVIESLQQLIFITEKSEQERFEDIIKLYREIRLLTETS